MWSLPLPPCAVPLLLPFHSAPEGKGHASTKGGVLLLLLVYLAENSLERVTGTMLWCPRNRGPYSGHSVKEMIAAPFGRAPLRGQLRDAKRNGTGYFSPGLVLSLVYSQ